MTDNITSLHQNTSIYQDSLTSDVSSEGWSKLRKVLTRMDNSISELEDKMEDAEYALCSIDKKVRDAQLKAEFAKAQLLLVIARRQKALNVMDDLQARMDAARSVRDRITGRLPEHVREQFDEDLTA